MAPTTRSGQRPGDKSRSSGDEPRRAVNKRHVEETRRAASDRQRDRNRTAQSAGNQDEEAGPKARENDEDQNSANGAGERRGHASGQNRPERDREDGSEVDRGADRELDSGSDLLPGGGHRPMERRDARPPPAGPGTGQKVGPVEAPTEGYRRPERRAYDGPRTGAKRDAEPSWPSTATRATSRDPGSTTPHATPIRAACSSSRSTGEGTTG